LHCEIGVHVLVVVLLQHSIEHVFIVNTCNTFGAYNLFGCVRSMCSCNTLFGSWICV